MPVCGDLPISCPFGSCPLRPSESMDVSPSPSAASGNGVVSIPLSRFRARVWLISAVVVLTSVIGLALSSIQLVPLRPGLDFTEARRFSWRNCGDSCRNLQASAISEARRGDWPTEIDQAIPAHRKSCSCWMG